MVVFTCNNCGESLQKPKVAKHYQFQCRKSISLTCVDCFKDFLGDEYTTHTKCITEAERYGGKNYVAKPSANKGEKKQQAWIEMINNIVNSSPNLSRDEKSLLEYISGHENTPRKRAKFVNFVRNSLGNRVSQNVIESCWNKLESGLKELTQNSNKKNTPVTKTVTNKETNGVKPEDENKSKDAQDPTVTSGNEEVKKKSKKRKLESNGADEIEEPAVKVAMNEDSTPTVVKFDWKVSILDIIGTKNEISMKKLEKKIVKRYLKNETTDVPREKIISRLQKKLKKIPELSIVDDKVKRV